MKLSTIVNSYNDLKVLVVGDIMLDTYLWGKSSRISPEAPVPVVDIEGSEDRLGGAANVALNLAQLGAEVFLSSVWGQDPEKQVLSELLYENSISSEYIVTDETRRTTQKTRIISHGKHIVRFDSENTEDILQPVRQSILSHIKKIISSHSPNAIILQDYNKGLLTYDLIESVISLARSADIFVSVDPKKSNFFAYKDVDLFKPNLLEIRNALNIKVDAKSFESLTQACDILSDKLKCRKILLTLSDRGVYYYNTDGEKNIIDAHLRNIVDVSGAGDTVISVATASLAVDNDLGKAAALSNLAGGLVCEKVGVVPISNSDLLDALRQDNQEEIRITY